MLLDEMRAALKQLEDAEEIDREDHGAYSSSERLRELVEIIAAYEYHLRGTNWTVGRKKIEWTHARRFQAWKKKHCGVAE
jgi:hypothetical protein